MKIDDVTGGRNRRSMAALDRHSRKCRICCHPNRESIEDDFLNWRNPHQIVGEYQLPHYSAIYRHARALGLTARRNENIRTVLDSIVERARQAPVTGNTILKAMRAYSSITDDGRWVDPPTYVIHQSTRKEPAPALASDPPLASDAPLASDPALIEASVPAPEDANSDPPSDPEIPGNLIANAGLENASTR
jgi:hypothetical protein